MVECIDENWKYDNKLNTYCKRFITLLTEPNYCVKKYNFSYPWWKKNNIFESCISAFNWYFIVILVLFFIACFVPPISGADTVNSSINVIYITDESITWDYKYLTVNRPLGALLDGVEITGFNTNFEGNYTAKELEPNSTHSFCLYGEVTINCEYATTTITKKSVDFIYDFIWEFMLFIVIIICLFVAIKYNVVGFAAFIFSVLGLILKLNNYILIDKLEFSTFITGTLYFIFAIASLFIAFNKD